LTLLQTAGGWLSPFEFPVLAVKSMADATRWLRIAATNLPYEAYMVGGKKRN
jgi:hypothetical protein